MDSRQMKMMSRSRENEMSNQECSTSQQLIKQYTIRVACPRNVLREAGLILAQEIRNNHECCVYDSHELVQVTLESKAKPSTNALRCNGDYP